VNEPQPTGQDKEELLEQWDFLDSLVDRQAAQLRAGIQDSEVVDEPVAATTAATVGRITELEVELQHAASAAVQTAARVRESEAAAARMAARHHELLEALRAAHTQIEELRSANAAAQPKPWWRFGR